MTGPAFETAFAARGDKWFVAYAVKQGPMSRTTLRVGLVVGRSLFIRHLPGGSDAWTFDTLEDALDLCWTILRQKGSGLYQVMVSPDEYDHAKLKERVAEYMATKEGLETIADGGKSP